MVQQYEQLTLDKHQTNIMLWPP